MVCTSFKKKQKKEKPKPVTLEEGLALCDFILVVREPQVPSPRVQVRSRGHITYRGGGGGVCIQRLELVVVKLVVVSSVLAQVTSSRVQVRSRGHINCQ